MCELYEELLEEKNKELEQLETQLLTCQQEIRRLRSVCRDYEQEREININWKLSSLEDILKRLGAQIPYSEEKKSKSPFTKEGKKAYDDLKKILSAVGNLTGTDMKKIINLLEDAAIQKQNDLELSQLRLLLKTFKEHSWKGNYSLGKWKISNGGYDLWFEVYYNETMVLQCVAGLVTANAESQINQKEVLHCVLEEYRNVKIG